MGHSLTRSYHTDRQISQSSRHCYYVSTLKDTRFGSCRALVGTQFYVALLCTCKAKSCAALRVVNRFLRDCRLLQAAVKTNQTVHALSALIFTLYSSNCMKSPLRTVRKLPRIAPPSKAPKKKKKKKKRLQPDGRNFFVRRSSDQPRLSCSSNSLHSSLRSRYRANGTMSAPVPQKFNAEEADNLEDVSLRTACR
jgi:hypothetical protein